MNIKMINVFSIRVKEEIIRTLTHIFSLGAMYSLKTEELLSFITCHTALTYTLSGSTAPVSFSLALGRQLCVSCLPHSLYPYSNSPPYPLNRILSRSQSLYKHFRKRQKSLLLERTELSSSPIA